jgi:hypothetical protein
MSLFVRLITLGLYGGRKDTPDAIASETPDPLLDTQPVSELPKEVDVEVQIPCRLTDREKANMGQFKDVAYAKTLLHLGQERAKALQYLKDFEQDAYLPDAILELREGSSFREKLEKRGAKTYEDALDLTSDWQEVHNLLSAAAKAAVRKYISPEFIQDKAGSYYKSPKGGKEVHFETASPYSLYDDLKEFRKQYDEIRRLAGLK